MMLIVLLNIVKKFVDKSPSLSQALNWQNWLIDLCQNIVLQSTWTSTDVLNVGCLWMLLEWEKWEHKSSPRKGNEVNAIKTALMVDLKKVKWVKVILSLSTMSRIWRVLLLGNRGKAVVVMAVLEWMKLK